MLDLCIACLAGSCVVAHTPAEQRYLPVLHSAISTYWEELTWPSVLAAQIRQETCPSMSSRLCWNPRAELKTSREYGFGLGQITITTRFNNFQEAKKLNPILKTWEWGNRYDADYQIKALVLMNKDNYARFKAIPDTHERLAFTFAAYNGGVGGVLSDKAVCRAVPGCDDKRWFGNVEHHSKKAKVPVSGYGMSFFQINRGYVTHVMGNYRVRYLNYFKECDDVSIGN